MTPKLIVTGVAGFVGSTLARRLLEEGRDVVGVDCLTDYYAPAIKRDNLAPLLEHDRFVFHEKDVLEIDWKRELEGVGTVFHLAAQAGVRASWGSGFQEYTDRNIMATQAILEALKDTGIRMVYSSSSSVYGDTVRLPMNEDDPTAPYSPYGVTKLAAEHLCRLYWRNFGVSTVSLRYFTVYGPRQRPDMAFHKFLKAALADEPIPLYGDGDQTRDFTFVDDAVEANILAAARGRDGGVYNIGGGSRTTVNDVLARMETILGRPVRRRDLGAQKGDVRHTYADTTRAREDLGFVPKVGLDEGLAREARWVEERLALLV